MMPAWFNEMTRIVVQRRFLEQMSIEPLINNMNQFQNFVTASCQLARSTETRFGN